MHDWLAVEQPDKKHPVGIVRAIGVGCEHCKINCNVTLGDTILFKENGYTEQDINGEPRLLIHRTDVQAIINPKETIA